MIRNERDCLKLIDRYVLANYDQKINYKFIWSQLLNDQSIIDFISSHIDHHQNTKYELLLGLLARVYVKNFDKFEPEIVNEISNQFFKTENKRLVLSTHGDFTPFTRLILENKKSIAILSSYKIAISSLSANTGIDARDVILIPRDKNCLIVINQFLKKHYAVSCTVDFRKSLQDGFVFLSKSLFQFAHSVRVPVYFSIYHVDKLGNLHLRLDGPHFDEVNNLVNKFKECVKKYKPHTHYEIAKFETIEQSNMSIKFFIKRVFRFLSRKMSKY